MAKQLHHRHPKDFIAEVLRAFNTHQLPEDQACEMLGVKRARLYRLRAQWLRATQRGQRWEPGRRPGRQAQVLSPSWRSKPSSVLGRRFIAIPCGGLPWRAACIRGCRRKWPSPVFGWVHPRFVRCHSRESGNLILIFMRMTTKGTDKLGMHPEALTRFLYQVEQSPLLLRVERLESKQDEKLASPLKTSVQISKVTIP